jgi:hypothetical protein
MEIDRAAKDTQINRLVTEQFRNSAQAILGDCSRDMADPLGTRVQLAVLKLYEQSGCGGTESLAEIAQHNRRNILAWAANPGLMRAPTQLDEKPPKAHSRTGPPTISGKA